MKIYGTDKKYNINKILDGIDRARPISPRFDGFGDMVDPWSV